MNSAKVFTASEVVAMLRRYGQSTFHLGYLHAQGKIATAEYQKVSNHADYAEDILIDMIKSLYNEVNHVTL